MFTVRSISDEGVYYLVNGWNRNKTFWVNKEDLRKDMLFNKAADAKRSLTKLLKVMEEYRTDEFNIVEFREEDLSLGKFNPLYVGYLSA